MPPETLALIARYQHQRDPRAIATLLNDNRRWLREVAGRSARKFGLDFDDAEQAARIGFAEAVATFDPTFGSTVQAYAAASHIKKQMMHAAAERHVPSMLPQGLHARDRIQTIKKAMRHLRAEGLVPTDEAIAAKTEIGVATVEAYRAALDFVSLDTPVSKEGETTLLDLVPCAAKRPDQLAIEKLDGRKVKEAVESVLDGLDDRSVDIFRGRFERDETLEELGDRYGITRERVRQLEARVVAKMQERLAGDPRVVGFLEA